MKRILVCVDGSVPYTDSCLAHAAWLTRVTGAHIDVVYVSDFRQMEVSLVADFSGSLGVQPYQGLLSQIEEIEHEKAEILERYVYDFFTKENLRDNVTFQHKVGYLVDMLEDFELDEDNPADMTLLGKRGEHANYAKEHLGSMMERIVRASCKPCLVTSKKFHPITKVLFAYDGGDSCEKALHFFKHQDFLKKLELHIVSVGDDSTDSKMPSYLQEAQKALTEMGYNSQAHYLRGHVEDSISKYIEENGIHLLVMGAYGHSRIRYLLIGSTTTEILLRCQVPVLLFH